MDLFMENEIIFNDDVLEIISARYNTKKYHTWADSVLISLNPFTCSSDDEEKRKSLKEILKSKKVNERFEPHTYSVAHRAFCSLMANSVDQVIVISGDSGSGKTYSTQLALDYLAVKNTSLGQIHYALVLLNALSNAGTEYHGDSSRVSKLISLGYNEYSGEIVSAKLHTYLLEKTRVSSPTVRNFHIFYQVLSSEHICRKFNLHLISNVEYRILPGKSTFTSLKPLDETLEALENLQFKESAIQGLLTVIAIILHLGNINFIMDDRGNFCVEKNHDDCLLALQFASELMGVNLDSLESLLIYNVITTESAKSLRHSTYHIPVATLTEAVAKRDSLMKFLYTLLFNWVVSTVNSVFKRTPDQVTHSVGLLDIYGFEVFSRNSLEQLCINYANECLHQYFIQDILVQKTIILSNEGVLPRNAPQVEENYLKEMNTRINLLHAPFSLFGIINEASLLSRHSTGTEYLSGKDLCHRITTLPKNKFLSANIHEQKFTFLHFAGSIKYDAKQMVAKNCDKIPNEIINVLMSSSNRFLVQLLRREESHIPKHTVLSKFKNSFENLIKHLRTAQVHYIRCIKTNVQMKPGHVDKKFLEKQLQSSGILEAVKLCGHSYLVRISFEDFLRRYKFLIPNKNNHLGSLAVEQQKEVITRWMIDIKMDFQIGYSSVFIKEGTALLLDTIKRFLANYQARTIQRGWRHFIKIKEVKSKEKMFVDCAARTIQRYVRNFLLDKKVRAHDNMKSLQINLSKMEPIISENKDKTTHSGSKEVKLCKTSVTSTPIVEPSCSYSTNKIMEKNKETKNIDQLKKITFYKASDSSLLTDYILNRKVHVTGHFLKDVKISKLLKGNEVYFIGNGVVSRRALIETPIWFHTRPPLIPSLNIEPHCIIPKGVEDALL